MFSELTGNERVKKLLRRLLSSGRIPGALLFSGETGVGKKLFALELARALNCRNLNGVEGCGKCAVCKRISHFNFPESDEAEDWTNIIWTDHGDVGLVVAPKRLLRVNQMRKIESEANFRPFEGRARVFLIDDADRLNEQSSNALLKILEEPPPTSHVILITSRPAMLLPTIRSRCQVVRFSPLTADEIERYLVENRLAKGPEAHLLARYSGGSLGRALKCNLEEYKKHREVMLQTLRGAADGNHTQLLRSAETMNEARYKDDYEFRLDLLENLIRDVLILHVGAGDDRVVNDDLLPELNDIASKTDTMRAANWIAGIEEMREQLVVNINRKVATDSLFLTMASS